ncbi:MAG: SUMF1/EgtB/PvdO family nonheme iron enzyme [Planctomycetes bacterium]|nr:SUMF1/EgtB/PvdO family nonheme iron enzyme [Planctomycetota bacterium]
MNTRQVSHAMNLQSTPSRHSWPLPAICSLVALTFAADVWSDVEIPLVTVGDPGNPPDSTGLGSVAREFRIGRFEVTSAQYAVFLNAVARSDPQGLYHPAMSIARTGTEGEYLYSTTAGEDDLPVRFVSYHDALRFANWLHNGQPEGEQGPATTENGAYTLEGPMAAGDRRPDARFFLPSEDEWYKAAYHRGGAAEGYWRFPTRSDQPPTAAAPGDGDSLANFDQVAGGVTPVGSYPDAAGPYGTFDQAGNVWEWVETAIDIDRGLRGGSWDDYELLMDSMYRDCDDPDAELEFIGFRIAAATSGAPSFRRGMVNADASVDMSDAISIFGYLFLGSATPGCIGAADTNDDGGVDISDGVTLLGHLFLGGARLPEPFAECGVDPTPDSLGCETFSHCQ